MKTYRISIYGQVKRNIEARNPESAVIKASQIWANGETRGISALEIQKRDKADYEVHEYISGYFGICRKGTFGASPVWGGDSAWEDCYSEDLANSIYKEWDGTLYHCTNDKYGEEGYTIEV